MASFWVTGQGVAWWNLKDSCVGWHENATNKINCLWGALTSVVTSAVAFHHGHKVFGHISQWMGSNGVTWGSFGASNTKRDHPELDALLGEFSTVFGGANVSHIGMWDYTPPSSSDKHRFTRSIPQRRDVFAVEHDDFHFHFAYLDKHTDGHAFRFGFGLPRSGDDLQKREQGFFNEAFTEGGIDIASWGNPDGSPDEPNIDGWKAFPAYYEQISCTLNERIFEMDQFAQGHHFQIYASEGTLATGAVAGYLPGKPSAIHDVAKYLGSIEVDEDCVPDP
jgi:hypothetical protein